MENLVKSVFNINYHNCTLKQDNYSAEIFTKSLLTFASISDLITKCTDKVSIFVWNHYITTYTTSQQQQHHMHKVTNIEIEAHNRTMEYV